MIKYRRFIPTWGMGTVYHVFDTSKHQLSVRFMPWKMLPGFSFCKKG